MSKQIEYKHHFMCFHITSCNIDLQKDRYEMNKKKRAKFRNENINKKEANVTLYIDARSLRKKFGRVRTY